MNNSGADSAAVAQSLLHCWLGSSSTRKEGVSLNNRDRTRMQIAPVRVSKESIAFPENLQKGRSLKHALQLTLASHQTFNALATMKLQPCTLQAMQCWLHFRGFARFGWVKKSTYLLLARTSPLLGWGKGTHKRLCLPCRSLLPSIPRSEASSGLACNKGAKYKPRSSCTRSLWASGNLFSVQMLAF